MMSIRLPKTLTQDNIQPSFVCVCVVRLTKYGTRCVILHTKLCNWK